MTRSGDPDLKRRLGQRVLSLRLEQGISSQDQLAEMAGLHRTYVGRVERGEVNLTISSLARIAAALNVSLSELLSVVEAENDCLAEDEP